jgi:hypothetical protein
MRKIQQQFVIVMIVAIVMYISAAAVVIPQAAYANQDEENLSPSDNCASDEVPAIIDRTMDCLRPEECKSFEIEGKVAKHCNFMMTDE